MQYLKRGKKKMNKVFRIYFTKTASSKKLFTKDVTTMEEYEKWYIKIGQRVIIKKLLVKTLENVA